MNVLISFNLMGGKKKKKMTCSHYRKFRKSVIFKKEIKISYHPISLKYLLSTAIHDLYFSIISANSVNSF